MDGTLPKISILKLQGVGGPITPRGWMGVDGMDLDHNITQNIHIKTFLKVRDHQKNIGWISISKFSKIKYSVSLS